MKLRILLVDDATFIRDLIKRTLRKFLPACEIVEASDGRKAQSILNKQHVDLILSDWEMPGMSGEELLIWVRAEERIASTPFIMVSSLGAKTHIVRAVELGVNDYLGKPFTSEELMQKVHKALVRAGHLKPVQQNNVQNTGVFSSLEIFSSRGETPVSGSADALLSSAGAETKPARETSKMKGTGLIRFDDQQLKCMIKSIDNEEMSVISRRASRLPSVFERLQLDLSPGNDAGGILSGLNAYVHSMTAVEKKPDAEFLTLVIRFDTADAHTKEQLSLFLASGQDT
ncbi:MAG: response regulator [Pseudomonadota bacterium]